MNNKDEDIVKEHSRNIIHAAYIYVKNIADAEDVAQETFLEYIKRKPEFENKEHEKAWLMRVAVNKSKNHLKTSWIRKRTSLKDDFTCLQEEENDLILAVLKLEIKYRIPIHMFYYEGYSIKEIASILGASPSTIGTRLDRGRKNLKRMIGGRSDE